MKFCVQVLVSDQWITMEGAEALPPEEAHALQAAECEIVGQYRVRMLPVPDRKHTEAL